MPLRSFVCEFLRGYVFISLDYVSRSGTARPNSNSVFNTLRNCEPIPEMAKQFYIPTNRTWRFDFSLTSPTLTVSCIKAILVGERSVLTFKSLRNCVQRLTPAWTLCTEPVMPTGHFSEWPRAGLEPKAWVGFSTCSPYCTKSLL